VTNKIITQNIYNVELHQVEHYEMLVQEDYSIWLVLIFPDQHWLNYFFQTAQPVRKSNLCLNQ
jgi:hypothetical protein